MSVEHWMQFSTFAEKDYFIYPSADTYDGIVLNANMVVHASAAMAAFLIEKRGQRVKFIIDPMTHAFQHDPTFIKSNKGETKSSIKNLSDEYGEPISSMVGVRGISSTDLDSHSVKENFVKQVLEFQYNYLMSYMESADSFKYLDEEDKQELRPHALIAPYFYVQETNFEEIIALNKELLQIACEQNEELDRKTFGACVLSQGALTNDLIRSSILENYSDLNVDGFTVWVDELVEQKASIQELECLYQLGSALRFGDSAEVINLHGGYFSVAASGGSDLSAFSGVCHGPEFGESRAVVPVGGGIPISRFYVPDLHTREKYRDVVGIFNSAGWLNTSDTFYDNICPCPHCKEVINNSPDNFQTYGASDVKNVKRKNGVVRIDFPTSEAKIHCLKHYLENKKTEYSLVDNMPIDEIIEELNNSISKYASAAGDSFFSHLHIWKKALQNIHTNVNEGSD